jgi:hypothetical protein
MSANASHGLRRTNADKRNAVEMALADPEWSKLPNTQIAEMCAVAESFIRKIKLEHEHGAVSHCATPVDPAVNTPSVVGSYSPTVEEVQVQASGNVKHTDETMPGSEPKKSSPWSVRFNRLLHLLTVRGGGDGLIVFASREEVERFIDDLKTALNDWEEPIADSGGR